MAPLVHNMLTVGVGTDSHCIDMKGEQVSVISDSTCSADTGRSTLEHDVKYNQLL